MQGDGFLDALRDDPDDVVTRLVYADWLDDQGDGVRASHIRRAIQVEQLPPDDPDAAALKDELARELQDHQLTWLGPRPETLTSWSFRGGLVDQLCFSSDAGLDDIEPLLHRHPVRSLVLAGARSVRELSGSPVIGLVRSLTIGSLSRTARRIVDRVFDNPHLNLTSLSLAGDVVDNYLARVLAQSSGLARLRQLCLRSLVLSDAGVVALLRQGVLSQLEEWHVQCPQVSGLALANLTRPWRASRWRSLHWTSRFCAPGHQQGLARCAALRELNVILPSRRAETKIMPWLNGLLSLTILKLGGLLDLPGVQELADWPGLSRLQLLDLSQAQVFDREQARDVLTGSRYAMPGMQVKLTG